MSEEKPFVKPAHWCQVHPDCVSATSQVPHECPALTRRTVSGEKPMSDLAWLIIDRHFADVNNQFLLESFNRVSVRSLWRVGLDALLLR